MTVKTGMTTVHKMATMTDTEVAIFGSLLICGGLAATMFGTSFIYIRLKGV